MSETANEYRERVEGRNKEEDIKQVENSKTEPKIKGCGQGFAAHPETINRRGRPKKERTIAYYQQKILEEKIKDPTTGEDITKYEVLARAWYAMALADPTAIKGFVSHQEPAPPQEIDAKVEYMDFRLIAKEENDL